MVPEVVRWQTPVIYNARVTRRAYELAGKHIREGDVVALWLISGNRDGTAIRHADRFIVDRSNPHKHLSFGYGEHRCIGSRLGELQLRILWEEIVPRFRRIEVTGPPQRSLSNTLRGITSLPVRLHAA